MVSTSLCSIDLSMSTIYIFHRYTVSTLHHFTDFVYDIITNYPGKLYQLVHKYQGTEEGLLHHFERDEGFKDRNVFKVPSWNVCNLPSFKSSQNSPNEFEQRGLE